MKYFGPPDRGARLAWPSYEEPVEAPVGVPCGHCEERIQACDAGWLIPSGSGNPIPFHRACFIRTIVGSVAHQQRRCCCFVPGSSCNDDPALTVREAAEAAAAFSAGPVH